MNRNLIINNISSDKICHIEEDYYDNVLIFFRNKYQKGEIKSSVLEQAQYYIDNTPFLYYKNIIVIPSAVNNSSAVKDSLLYVIWFSKDKNSYFNKDEIREPHIWKDVEWGKRSKNYSQKGKDPSNIWIPTLDDGKGKITHHIKLDIKQILGRVYTAFNQSEETEWYLDNHLKDFVEIEAEFLTEINKFENDKINCNTNDQTIISNTEQMKLGTYEIKFDSSENIKLKGEVVDSIVTSPPYWDLKNYFKDGQIGHESYESYLLRMYNVWTNLYKILSETGVLFVNINIRTRLGKVYNMPYEYIKQMRALGFKFIDIIIWHKSSSIPVNANNLSDKYEFVLVFAKSSNYKLNYCQNFNDYKNDYLNNTNIWNINRKAGSIGKKFIHPAIYPTELVNRLVLISTKPGDMVFDPFLGSGTTLISAVNLSRNFIGYEYNEDFEELINYRINNEVILGENSKIKI
ncbi:DNA-methyltransferase [Salinicoccus luteus]|uniref:DNA-methyltransferase n=1 Tax=Salinicoccus luteus TaxID=367840 RepID=UPI00055D9AC7|nr:site-specific DNA-methyltransferase [Salinicoccus luteus]